MSPGDFDLAFDSGAQSLRVEMEAAIMAAAVRPRDERAIMKQLKKLARDAEWAEDATMVIDDEEHGAVLLPSVRFARPLARAFRYVMCAVRILRTSRETEELEGFAFDAQTVRSDRIPGVLRKVVKRKHPTTGAKVEVELDEEQILRARNRLGAILVRRAILNVIPKPFVDELMIECQKTLDKAAAKRLQVDAEKARANLLAGWAAFGSTKDDLEAHLGHGIEAVTSEELRKLEGMLRSVQQGSASVSSIFARAAAEQAATGVEAIEISPIVTPSPAAVQPPVSPGRFLPPPSESAGPRSESFWSSMRPQSETNT